MRPVALAWLVPASFALFACGGSDDGGGPAAPPATRVASVEISGAAPALELGRTMQLTATAKDSAGATVVGRQVTWSSSAPTVATVDLTGLVRAVATGQTTISAVAEGRNASVTVAVRDTASLTAALSGRIARVSLTLQAGRTYRVTSELVLVADKVLTIAGTLLVTPGISVALFGGDSLVVTGSILADTTAASGVSPGLALRRAAATGDFVLGSSTVFIAPGGSLGTRVSPAGPIYIAGKAGVASGVLLRDAHVEPAKAANGTAANRRGDDGFRVEIGTAAAQQKAQGAVPQPGPIDRITVVRSKLFAGQGGNGYQISSRADGLVKGNLWDGRAGDGGAGGDLMIESQVIDVTSSQVRAGVGGLGGFIKLQGTDRLRDGSFAISKGESMLGVTGSGGANGGLAVSATRVLNADAFTSERPASPGGANVEGGNGWDGGAGGDLAVRLGLPGLDGGNRVPAGVIVNSLGVAGRTVVTFLDAANGGDSNDPTRRGGKGGTVVVDNRNGGAPYVSAVDFGIVANGGRGFNGCLRSPRTDGTDGGDGGVRRVGAPRLNETGANFNGGDGRDGVNYAGVGGTGGLDALANVPIGVSGANGKQCPNYVSATPSSVGFQHTVGVTPCPQVVGTITVRNPSNVPISYQVTAPGVSGLTFVNGTGTLQPGASIPVTVIFDCSRATSFTGQVQVTAAPLAGGASQTESVSVTGTVSVRAVRLNYALGPHAAGTVIELSRITNGSPVTAHAPFCLYDHLHGLTTAGIGIDGAGPYGDPEVVGCGYGEIILVKK